MHAIDRLFSFAIAFHRLIVTTMRCANQYVDAPMVVDGCVNRRMQQRCSSRAMASPCSFPFPLFDVDAQFFEQTKKSGLKLKPGSSFIQ